MKVIRRTRKEVVKRWVAALRSGEYTQARKSLRDGDSFCCFGVLCDLAARDGGPQWKKEKPFKDDWHFAYRTSFPPEKITEYVGLTESAVEDLVTRNDSGYSFKEIADVIENLLLR